MTFSSIMRGVELDIGFDEAGSKEHVEGVPVWFGRFGRDTAIRLGA